MPRIVASCGFLPSRAQKVRYPGSVRAPLSRSDVDQVGSGVPQHWPREAACGSTTVSATAAGWNRRGIHRAVGRSGHRVARSRVPCRGCNARSASHDRAPERVRRRHCQEILDVSSIEEFEPTELDEGDVPSRQFDLKWAAMMRRLQRHSKARLSPKLSSGDALAVAWVSRRKRHGQACNCAAIVS